VETPDTPMDLMVITAHPDDAEFGAAGTVATWTREGKKAVYVVCTDGDKGTSDRSLTSRELVGIRHKRYQTKNPGLRPKYIDDGIKNVGGHPDPDARTPSRADRVSGVRQNTTYHRRSDL
jgi:hypothetical protein